MRCVERSGVAYTTGSQWRMPGSQSVAQALTSRSPVNGAPAETIVRPASPAVNGGRTPPPPQGPPTPPPPPPTPPPPPPPLPAPSPRPRQTRLAGSCAPLPVLRGLPAGRGGPAVHGG